MKEQMPNRVFDVGISEGHAVTFAGGLAKEGLRPVVAIYSAFLQRAYDHIIHDVALMNLPVIFCIDRAGIVGEDGATHHGALDIAYMRSIPNMIVTAPRNEHELRNLMFTAMSREKQPMSIRYPRGNGSLEDWENPLSLMQIGKGEKLSEGENLAVLSTGVATEEASEALKSINSERTKVAHYHFPFIKPLDEDLLREIVNNYSDIITVEDGTINGGFGSAISEWISTNSNAEVRITRLGMPDKFVTQGTVAQLKHLCGIDAESIKSTIIKHLEKKDIE